MFAISDYQILLRKKAAEELKKEQEEKARERRRVIDERCGKPKPVDGLSRGKEGSDGKLHRLIKLFYSDNRATFGFVQGVPCKNLRDRKHQVRY